jgi:hypothetical protein
MSFAEFFDGLPAPLMAQGPTHIPGLDEYKHEPNEADFTIEHEYKLEQDPKSLEHFSANNPAKQNPNGRVSHHIRYATAIGYRRKRISAKILKNPSTLSYGCLADSITFDQYQFSRLNKQYGPVTLNACAFAFDNVCPNYSFASKPTAA